MIYELVAYSVVAFRVEHMVTGYHFEVEAAHAIPCLLGNHIGQPLSVLFVKDLCPKRGNVELFHHDFQVDKYFRLEGETDPSDSVIIYAISALTNGEKGILVNSYGIYADPIASEMLEKLAFKH